MRVLLALYLFASLAIAQEPVRAKPLRSPAVIAPQAGATAAALEDVSADMRRLHAGLASAGSALAQGAAMYQQYDQQLDAYLQLVATAARGDAAAQGRLVLATQQMRESRMSFNLQYLNLQSQMQNENRQYTTISNVMKTKHDTAKNAINNMR